MAFRHAPRLESHRDEPTPLSKPREAFIPRSGNTWRDPKMDIMLPGREKESVGGIRVVNGDELPKPRIKKGGVGSSRMPIDVPEGGGQLAKELEKFLAKKKSGRLRLEGLSPKGPKRPEDIN